MIKCWKCNGRHLQPKYIVELGDGLSATKIWWDCTDCGAKVDIKATDEVIEWSRSYCWQSVVKQTDE